MISVVELFEHTADVGLRVRAANLEALLAEAGRALFGLMVARPEAIASRETRTVSVEGDQVDYLFCDWLTELLYLFDSARWVGREVEVTAVEGRVEGRIGGEPFDARRHGRGNEVKAITYHGLRVEQHGDQWLGEVIVDI